MKMPFFDCGTNSAVQTPDPLERGKCQGFWQQEGRRLRIKHSLPGREPHPLTLGRLEGGSQRIIGKKKTALEQREPLGAGGEMRMRGGRGLVTFSVIAIVVLSSCDVAVTFVNVPGKFAGIGSLSSRGGGLRVPLGCRRLRLEGKARASSRGLPGALGVVRMSNKATKGEGSILDGAVSFFANAVGIDFMTAEERAAKEKEVEAAGGTKVKEEKEKEQEQEQEEGQDLETARRRIEYDGKVARLEQDFLQVRELLAAMEESDDGARRKEQFRLCLERSKFLIQSLCMWVPEGGAPQAAVGNISLPDAHCRALDFVSTLQADAKERDPKLASCFKWLPKKLGLSPLMSIIGRGGTPSYRTPREMRLACRDVERGVSEAVHLVATHACLSRGSSQGDYVDSCRSGLEHINVRDRHAAVMLLSAYFRLLPSATGSTRPVWGDFKKRFPSDFGHSTASARAAYPLLEIPARQWSEATGMGGVDTVRLMERLTRADPLGDTCEGMQRWAVSEGLLSRVDRNAARAARRADPGETAGEGEAQTSNVRRAALKHQLMRELTGAAPALVQGVDTDQWKQSLIPLGAMVSLLSSATMEDGSPLEGSDLIMASNGVMMLAALRHLHYPSQREYMSLVAQVNQAEGKIGGRWRDVLDSLELGLSQVLELDSSDGVLRARLEDMLRKWRMPQLLIRLWEIQSDDVEISGLIKTLLQALMSPSPSEEISSIRLGHPLNLQHLDHLDQEVVSKWSSDESLPGTAEVESIFMMGEDTRTCMAIHPTNSNTQKGLLGYLLQGNTRLLVAKPLQGSEGRIKFRARAVARLLMRRDTGETVVFVDRVYFEGEKDAGAEEEIREQARQLAGSIRVPLYMAKDAMPDAEMVEQLKTPQSAGMYPFPAVELLEMDGISPYVWRDGRYGIGLLTRGDGIKTSVGGKALVVAVLFGGWSDCMSTYEQATRSGGGMASKMQRVQDIGALISADQRGTRTLQKKKKKRMPWELTY